jgi:hypothetical protein
MRFRTRRERRNLLVPDMNPLDLALPAQRVGQPIQAVADYAVDPLDTGCSEGFRELISNSFCHSLSPLLEQFRNIPVLCCPGAADLSYQQS